VRLRGVGPILSGAPSFFEILGVPRHYHLDPSALEQRFHDESRRLHPDRHARADGPTRVKNALAAAQLNEAYRTLREPIRRAEYLLKLEGIDVGDEKKTVAGEFLVEIMELREGLMDARLEQDVGRVRSLATDVRVRQATIRATLDAEFSRYEEGERGVLPAIAEALVADRYFRRFLDEVEAFEDTLAASA
jgi:molecular chaperone HscB